MVDQHIHSMSSDMEVRHQTNSESYYHQGVPVNRNTLLFSMPFGNTDSKFISDILKILSGMNTVCHILWLKDLGSWGYRDSMCMNGNTDFQYPQPWQLDLSIGCLALKL